MSRRETHPCGSHPPASHSRVAGLAGAAGGGEPPRPASRRARSNQLIVCVAVICCAALLCFATGCRDSDALKEIIYDQEADIIDYDTEDKYWINDPTADEESDAVSSEEVVSDNLETELTQNLVVYSSKPNSDYSAKKSVWSEEPDFEGIEASETVTFYLTREEDVKATLPSVVDEDDDDDSDESEIQVAGSSGKNSDTGSGGTGESTEEGEESSEAGETPKAESGEGGGLGGDLEIAAVDLTDDLAEIPTVDCIAAYGQFAVIVQMIGGEGALAAADKEMLANEGFQQVFADEGASDIATGWSGDGTDATEMNVDAIIDSGAGAILVTSSSYFDELSDDDKQKLNDAGIECCVVSALSDSSGIIRTVTVVGKLLRESTEIAEAGNTVQNAKDYKTFHNDVVKAACEAANGSKYKLAAHKDSSKYGIYERNNEGEYSFDTSAKWTVLIDEWDTSVTLKSGELSMNGIGIATVGYATTPASFYIQAGGFINSAAAKVGTTVTGTFPVWQFDSDLKCYKNYFEYAEGGAFDESLASKSTGSKLGIYSDTWASVLLCINKTSSSSSIGGSASIALPPSGFGTEDFPVVIAGTQEVKEKLIANSEKSDGAYHAYEYTMEYMGFYGPVSNQYAWGCIGASSDGSDNVYADGVIDEGDVIVNPCGLIGSWTDEGSVESFLESVWVNDTVNDTTDVGWSTYVDDFYYTFYRYDISEEDWDVINAGAEE